MENPGALILPNEPEMRREPLHFLTNHIVFDGRGKYLDPGDKRAVRANLLGWARRLKDLTGMGTSQFGEAWRVVEVFFKKELGLEKPPNPDHSPSLFSAGSRWLLFLREEREVVLLLKKLFLKREETEELRNVVGKVRWAGGEGRRGKGHLASASNLPHPAQGGVDWAQVEQFFNSPSPLWTIPPQEGEGGGGGNGSF